MSLKISVVTVSYNSGKTIRDTIASVNSQTYNNVEHIFIDGSSKDETLQIIQKTSTRLSTLVSEPDNGIYDAMNKGISKATGDVVVFLNSDDFYANHNVLEKVAKAFNVSSADVVYGDINYISQTNRSKIVRKWRSGDYVRWKLLLGWHPPHPGFFVKRKILTDLGGFKTNIGSSSDYDLMLRVLNLKDVCIHYCKENLVNMRVGGVSNQSFVHTMKANIQCLKSNFKERNPLFFLVPFLKPLSKIKQLI